MSSANHNSPAVVLNPRSIGYTSLLVRPTIMGFIASVLWYIIHRYIEFSSNDQGIFESMLVLIGFAHGLLASRQIMAAADRQQAIELSIKTGNKKLFDDNVQTSINPVIKMLLAVFSIIFFVIFLLYPFNSVYAGVVTVWIVMFVLYLLWAVAMELADPYNGIWRVSRTYIAKIFEINEKSL